MTGPELPGPEVGHDVAGLMALAERIAGEAAELIRAGGTQGARKVVAATKTSPTDVVTAMDRAVEELLRAAIHRARPDDAVLGEEGGLVAGVGTGTGTGVGTDAAAQRLTWVLDPIDGTVNYLYGQPAFAVSVAVVAGDPTTPGAWEPVAGCVLQPVGGDLYTAGRGAGAWFRAGGAGPDGGAPARRLSIPTPPELDAALIATGFGYRADRRRGQARVLGELLPQVRDIRRVGSASLDLCWLALGRWDAYYERGANVWDIAAAALVVTEAGGTIGGLRSVPAGPEMTVAAAEPLRSRLSGLLAELDADSDPAG